MDTFSFLVGLSVGTCFGGLAALVLLTTSRRPTRGYQPKPTGRLRGKPPSGGSSVSPPE